MIYEEIEEKPPIEQYTDLAIKEDGDKYKCGLSIYWSNLTVVADVRKSNVFTRARHTYRTIINNAHGAVHPGNMVAIIGTSGSGKTTLLSALANRNSKGLIVTGSVVVGGCKSRKFMNEISGYVYQDDVFLPNLTVMEYLNFTAQLKLDRRITGEQRLHLIKKLLYIMGLQHTKNTIITNTSFGKNKVNLSGGELKRLSVLLELITDPLMLFCDEPTTGLDSFTAYKLVKFLKQTAHTQNKTIVCSLHQPSDIIYEMFHQVILVYKGMIAFMGPTKDAVSYLKSHGVMPNDDEIQASFLIRCLAAEVNTKEEKTCLKLCNEYVKITSKIPKSVFLESSQINARKSPSWMFKLYIIVYRFYLQITRDSSFLIVCLLRTLLIPFIIGLCVMGSVTLTQTGIQALGGVLFSIMSEHLYSPMFALMGYFAGQMPIFYREYTNGTNTPIVFFLSNILCTIPDVLIFPILLTLLVYWFAALKLGFKAVAETCLIAVMVANVSCACGLFLSVVSGSVNLASTLSNPITYVLMLLSGYCAQLRSVPYIISWIKYINWFKLGLESLFIIQMEDVSYIKCPSNPNLPCLKTGTEVLHYFSYNEENLWPNVFHLAILYIIMNALSFLIFLHTLG